MAPTQAQNDILNMMSKYEGAFEQAKTKKNPFGASRLPPGEYVFKLAKAGLTMNGTAGKPKVPGVSFVFVCQCGADGDSTYFGEQFRVNRKVCATPNQSVEEAIERLMYDLQDLGVNTDDLVLTGSPPPPKFALLDLLAYLTTNGPYIKGTIKQSEVDVKTGNSFKNLNNIVKLGEEELEAIFGKGNFVSNTEQTIEAGSGAGVETTEYDDAEFPAEDGQPDPNGLTFPYLAEDNNWYDEAGNQVEPPSEHVPFEPEVVAPPPPAPAPAPRPAARPPARAPAQHYQPQPPPTAHVHPAPAGTPVTPPSAPKTAPVKRVGPPRRV